MERCKNSEILQWFHAFMALIFYFVLWMAPRTPNLHHLRQEQKMDRAEKQDEKDEV